MEAAAASDFAGKPKPTIIDICTTAEIYVSHEQYQGSLPFRP
jgi:hypothetical protein